LERVGLIIDHQSPRPRRPRLDGRAELASWVTSGTEKASRAALGRTGEAPVPMRSWGHLFPRKLGRHAPGL